MSSGAVVYVDTCQLSAVGQVNLRPHHVYPRTRLKTLVPLLNVLDAEHA